MNELKIIGNDFCVKITYKDNTIIFNSNKEKLKNGNVFHIYKNSGRFEKNDKPIPEDLKEGIIKYCASHLGGLKTKFIFED